MKYNDQGRKWLFVKNWDKYQPPTRMVSKTARNKWIRDWTDKLDNYDYQQLTGFQRHIFEGVCLLVATRPHRSVPNDATWIAHALHLVRSDIPHTGHAMSTIISRGFFELSTSESRDTYEHATSTARVDHEHVTDMLLREENASIDEDFPEELQKNRGRDRDREADADRETQVSESVSKSVSECSPEPSGYEALSEASKVIVNCLYPRFNPAFGNIQQHVPTLEEASAALTASGWKAFFEWNRSHKPDQLVFRSLPKFLEGVVYALNDYTAHDPAKCATCKPKEKRAKA